MEKTRGVAGPGGDRGGEEVGERRRREEGGRRDRVRWRGNGEGGMGGGREREWRWERKRERGKRAECKKTLVTECLLLLAYEVKAPPLVN